MEKRLIQNEEAMLVFKGSVGLAEGKVSFIKALRWKHACVLEFEEHQGSWGGQSTVKEEKSRRMT